MPAHLEKAFLIQPIARIELAHLHASIRYCAGHLLAHQEKPLGRRGRQGPLCNQCEDLKQVSNRGSMPPLLHSRLAIAQLIHGGVRPLGQAMPGFRRLQFQEKSNADAMLRAYRQAHSPQADQKVRSSQQHFRCPPLTVSVVAQLGLAALG